MGLDMDQVFAVVSQAIQKTEDDLKKFLEPGPKPGPLDGRMPGPLSGRVTGPTGGGGFNPSDPQWMIQLQVAQSKWMQATNMGSNMLANMREALKNVTQNMR